MEHIQLDKSQVETLVTALVELEAPHFQLSEEDKHYVTCVAMDVIDKEIDLSEVDPDEHYKLAFGVSLGTGLKRTIKETMEFFGSDQITLKVSDN